MLRASARVALAARGAAPAWRDDCAGARAAPQPASGRAHAVRTRRARSRVAPLVAVAAHAAPSLAPLPARPASLVASIAAAAAPAGGVAAGTPLASAFLMLGWVACALSGALAACLLAAVPALLSIRNAADELAALAASIRAEVPDTASAVRLSGLELSDAIEEVGGLTADVGQGLRSSARALAAAEASVRAVGTAVRTRALPAVQRRLVPVARTAAERSRQMLAERAALDDYSGPAIAAAAEGTAAGVSKVRAALQAAGIARRVGRAVSAVRASMRSSEPPPQ